MNDAQLQTIWQQRRMKGGVVPLAGPLSMLMKYTIGRKVRRVGELAEIWDELVPDEIRGHTALENFSRGTLTVMVDSAPHRYQLQTLLSGGLTDEIRQRFGGALNKIRTIPGQFYSVDISGRQRYEF